MKNHFTKIIRIRTCIGGKNPGRSIFLTSGIVGAVLSNCRITKKKLQVRLTLKEVIMYYNYTHSHLFTDVK